MASPPPPASPSRQPSLFGTDGLRGRAGEFPLDSATVESLGFFLAQVLGRDRGTAVPRVVVGWDGRESGPALLAALHAGIVRGSGQVEFAGLLPTPGVAFLTRDTNADAGISISASHNPWHDNGIKIFSATGEKLPAAEEQEIERHLRDGDRPPGGLVAAGPLPPEDGSLADRYRSFLAEADGNPDLSGMTVVVDAAHGAASRVAPRLFEMLGARVIAVGTSPDGRNINDGVGALHPDRVAHQVRESGADLGIALDGDADRLMMADGDGGIWDGDDILHLVATARLAAGRLEPRVVVATVMSNFALEEALSRAGVELVRTAVGDKHVWAEMVRRDAQVGGEQSGHLIFRPEATTGDGLLAALQVAAIAHERKAPLASLRALRKLPQLLRNVRVRERVPLDTIRPVAEEIARAERKLARRGRILVRYSGTEPLLRVMVEGESGEEIAAIAAAVVAVIERELGGATA